MESDLFDLLKTLCTHVYPDIAPAGVADPYVTWQGLGGPSIGFLDNTAADKRNTYLQINVWSSSRLQTNQLMRDIEAAMRAATAFTATPMGEPLSTFERDTNLYGAIQRFDIWSPR